VRIQELNGIRASQFAGCLIERQLRVNWFARLLHNDFHSPRIRDETFAAELVSLNVIA